jgi:hypothetical protein
MANSDVDGGARRNYRREGQGYPGDLRDVCPDLNNAGRDDGAGPAAGDERLLSNRSADLHRASSNDADAPRRRSPVIGRTDQTDPFRTLGPA